MRDWEQRIWLWYRDVFTAQLGKAVIGTDKEIVAADVMIVIIWRAVRRDGFGHLTPLELDGVLQLLPGKDGAVMDLGLVQLGCGTTILSIGLALVEALAVTVVEGDVTYAGPAVLDYGCGMEFGHGFMVLVLLYKGTKNRCKHSLVYTGMPCYSKGAAVTTSEYGVHNPDLEPAVRLKLGENVENTLTGALALLGIGAESTFYLGTRAFQITEFIFQAWRDDPALIGTAVVSFGIYLVKIAVILGVDLLV